MTKAAALGALPNITQLTWYDRGQIEWVFLAKVEARLQLPIQTLGLKAGDYVNITDHQKHRVEWTPPDEETVWLAIFYG